MQPAPGSGDHQQWKSGAIIRDSSVSRLLKSLSVNQINVQIYKTWVNILSLALGRSLTA